MKVNLSIVEKLIGFKLPPTDQLVERINERLGGVDEVIDLGAKYKDAKIVRVVECDKHPDADKLSVCKIDVGEDELVQVVCGAPNVKADMYAVWLPPKSVVPSTYGTDAPFVLDARKLRGVMSCGMLAAADELAIGTDHAGIVEITEKDIVSQIDSLKDPSLLELGKLVGSRFAEVFGLDSVIVDIENKMFTHRPDLFGQLGIAREISAILQDSASASEPIDNRFENPDWYWSRPEFSEAEGLDLEVFNDSPEDSPRFMSVAIKNIEVTSSPLWLQCQLIAMGSKSINNIVDWTNYIMLMTAQPTHAYDYDKLRGQKIGVRMARGGEKVTLLNGKTYELSDEDIVIADDEGAIGLAGVMGGFDSEVTSDTKNMVLEVANFNMYKVRKTSMRYGLFTDAVTRFNKGQSSLQTEYIAKRLLDLLPGEQASPVFDLYNKPTELDEVSVHGEVVYHVDFVNQRLGTDFTAVQISNILRPTNIATYSPGDDPDSLSSTAPFWRTDVEFPEDIVEEVGRLYGLDKVPRELPERSTKPAARNYTRQVKQQIRDSLSGSGANEVLTYSFVHESIFDKAGQSKDEAFRLSNALSPDLQYYRLSVLPSLLDKVHSNIKAGHDEFVLFEIGKGHDKSSPELDEDGLPVSYALVDMVYASRKPKDGAPYYQIKRIADKLFNDLGISTIIKPVDKDIASANLASFDNSRSSLYWSETKNSPFGVVGELEQAVITNFKLPVYTAAASFELKFIEMWSRKSESRYRALSRYPSISQDISLKVAADVAYQTVEEVIESVVGSQELEVKSSPVSIYQPSDDDSVKTLTFRLTFTSRDSTLKSQDIAPIISSIADTAHQALGAELI